MLGDPGASEASQHQDGYILATVTYPSMEDQALEEVDVEEMLKDLKDWQVRWEGSLVELVDSRAAEWSIVTCPRGFWQRKPACIQMGIQIERSGAMYAGMCRQLKAGLIGLGWRQSLLPSGVVYSCF